MNVESMMKTKTIRQKIHFTVSSKEVYDMLTSSKKHAAMTSSPARISKKIGGTFSVYDGYATGKNLALIDGKKIVQSWRAADWAEDHFSTVTFDLRPEKSECTLHFTHENVPLSQYDAIKKGWDEYYWKPMKEMFEKAE